MVSQLNWRGRILVFAALLVVVATGEARALQQSRTSTTAVGTGRIAGIVVDEQARRVRSAIVRLTGTELPMGRATITDDNGAFIFDQLPAGSFSLTSAKPAYLMATYGSKRPGGSGTSIAIAAGAQLADITLTMPHGGAIGGVIRDTTGAPIPSIQVSVVAASVAGEPSALPTRTSTDDRGAYRAFGLLPGSYLVSVAPQFSSGIGEVGIMSVAETDSVLARLQQRGSVAGTVPVAPGERSPSSIVRPTRTFSEAPVYFPGVPSPDAATLIAVGLSEVKENVDIVFQLARAAAVGGIVSGAAGQNVQLSLTPAGTVTIQALQLGGPMLQRRGSAGDGDFVFTNVTPGKYLLTARTGASGGRGGSAPSAGPPLFATAVVQVSGDDLSGIALTLQPMLHVSGRMTFSGPVQPPASILASFGLRLIPTGPGVEVQRTAIIAMIRPDWTFQFDGIMPGAYRLAISGEPAGWRSKSARLGTRDVFDVPFEVSTTDVTDIEVSLSDQHSQLAGRLTDANGAAATSYFVIAFAVDRAFWLPSSRRLRSIRPDTDGGFRLDDLPAGDYYLAALTEADSTEWQSPAFLDQVIAAAVKVTLGDSEKKIQNLRVGR